MTKEKNGPVTAIVFDFETGGLDNKKCGATQLAAHAVRIDTFEVVGKFNEYIFPYSYQAEVGKKSKVLRKKYEDEDEHLMEYSKEAENVSGITLEKLYADGKPITEVCQSFLDFIDNSTFDVTKANMPFLVGQNPLFDVGFIQQIMSYAGLWKEFCKRMRCVEDFFGNKQPYYVDTRILAQLSMANEEGVKGLSLGEISERLGIDLVDAHDADGDVTATREVLRYLTERMRNSESAGSTTVVTKESKLRDHFKI